MVAGEITVDRRIRGHVDVERVRQHTGAAAWQRQPHSIKQQPLRRQHKREKGRRRRGHKSRKRRVREKGKEVQEETDNEVEKDVTDWVKVDGGKTSVMEMEMSDKVDDIVTTSCGRILKGNDKLKICEVRDGITVEVTSRMRGGGHKDKKSKSEEKQTTNSERPEQKFDEESKGGEGSEIIPMDEAMRRLEESEEFQKKMECVSEGSEGEVQQKVQNYLACMQKVSWMNKEQFEHLESGVWQAVEARRKGRDEQQEQQRRGEQEQWRQTEQGQNTEQEQSKKVKQCAFRRRTRAGEDGSGKRRRARGDG